jgi:hypothetical protein
MSPDYRALCEQLMEFAEGKRYDGGAVIQRARAALAQPEQVALTRPDCFDFAMDFVGDPEETEVRRYVEALEARPTIQPVPVSERPWEREGWCDAEGQCWWFRPADFDKDSPVPSWYLDGSPAVKLIRFYGYTHSLPANALPTPEATNA